MRSLAAKLKDEQSLLVFGRGYNYATALEAALKASWRGLWGVAGSFMCRWAGGASAAWCCASCLPAARFACKQIPPNPPLPLLLPTGARKPPKPLPGGLRAGPGSRTGPQENAGACLASGPNP